MKRFAQHHLMRDDFWVRLGRFEAHAWAQNNALHLAFHWRRT